jgi:hypothetical protein
MVTVSIRFSLPFTVIASEAKQSRPEIASAACGRLAMTLVR